MPISPLPTDNLYKLMAIGPIVIIVSLTGAWFGATIKSNHEYATLELKSIEVLAESEWNLEDSKTLTERMQVTLDQYKGLNEELSEFDRIERQVPAKEAEVARGALTRLRNRLSEEASQQREELARLGQSIRQNGLEIDLNRAKSDHWKLWRDILGQMGLALLLSWLTCILVSYRGFKLWYTRTQVAQDAREGKSGDDKESK
ncbi:MAG: hypothetical protein WD716_06110 [Fimbriimonadaceae bacterium]